jgi:transcriptional/translational regulatory protein YebC/TACO1
MGTDGCVAFQFDHCGSLMFSPETDEDGLMEAALEAGAQDVISHTDSFEVLTAPYDFVEIKQALEKKGFHSALAEVGMKAKNDVELLGDEAIRMQKLLDALENLDDVQAVYSNAVLLDD